jgi:enterochelin esterase-like enzyme
MTRRLLDPTGHALGLAGGAVIRVAQRGPSAALALARRHLAGPVRLAGQHLVVVTAAGTAALCVLLAWLLGSGLEQWFVAQGMDDERADLLSAMVLALIATAMVGAASRRPAPTRVGGLVGFVAIQIVPFLIRAANAPGTPGLRYTQNVLGWILQPLGMLLLAAISVIVGAALGVGLAHDAARLPSLLRRRRLWPLIALAIALVVAGTGAALTALQIGPLSALRDYSVRPGPALSAVAPTPTPTPDGATAPIAAPTPDEALLRQIPGEIQYLTVGGHPVDVYVPGVYQADPDLAVPTLYLLHGTPGDQSEWLTGGQVEGVLDQLIAKGTIPPMIVVLPNGNERNSSDTEWGNSSQGDVETWLIDQVIPAVDTQYRTLGAAYRGIAGLSSGGFGAVNLAVLNPTDFSWAASYSGYYVGRSAIFGSAWRANSPLYTAAGVPAAERMPLYLGAGSQDYDFRPGTLQFAATLRSIGWTDYDLQTVPGGHGWVAWSAQFVQSLTWLGQIWGPTPWYTPPTQMAGPPAVASAATPGSPVSS